MIPLPALILSGQVHPVLTFPRALQVFDPSMQSINVNESCVYCLYPAIERGIVCENTECSVFMALSHVIDLACILLIVLAR